MPNSPVLVSPGEKLTFEFDWTDWLASGASISSRQWSITPQSGSPAQPSLTNDTSQTVIVDGFTHNEDYRLSEDIVASDGTSGKRSIWIRCQKR